jgi:alanine dehydrogenase
MTVGLPRMHKEEGERRVFLPEFVLSLRRLGAGALLEEGYGSELGIAPEEYLSPSSDGTLGSAVFCSREESFRADIVLLLRAPERPEFDYLGPESCLFSMLHFPTRSWRVNRLSAAGGRAIAMDQIVDDSGRRLVENLEAVAWNGLEAAFDLLGGTLPGLVRPDGGAVRSTILGTGVIGRLAADAACKYGRRSRNEQMIAVGHPGAIAVCLGRSATAREQTLRGVLRDTDVLVDATQRRDPSLPVVPNTFLSELPEHAVIADLSVDPYLLEDSPPVVRGIEGIPRGSLDKYRFSPEDSEWGATVPEGIPSEVRRPVASCYSWPGIHPRECMEHYGHQLYPLIERLISLGYDNLSDEGDYYTRALYRGSLAGFLKNAAHPD